MDAVDDLFGRKKPSSKRITQYMEAISQIYDIYKGDYTKGI